ncbi:MAG TPA: ribosome-associated translation inhibitor RaiA [bacterium]|nr:ribosome-associated translation inhibitor RaiA [bacterium]
MKIKIKATKIVVTPEIKTYVEEKMNILEKYLGDIKVQNFDIELEKVAGEQHSGSIFRAEANLALPGDLLRVEKTTKDLNKAIDKVKDHLAQAIKKYKGKREDKRKGK